MADNDPRQLVQDARATRARLIEALRRWSEARTQDNINNLNATIAGAELRAEQLRNSLLIYPESERARIIGQAVQLEREVEEARHRLGIPSEPLVRPAKRVEPPRIRIPPRPVEDGEQELPREPEVVPLPSPPEPERMIQLRGRVGRPIDPNLLREREEEPQHRKIVKEVLLRPMIAEHPRRPVARPEEMSDIETAESRRVREVGNALSITERSLEALREARRIWRNNPPTRPNVEAIVRAIVDTERHMNDINPLVAGMIQSERDRYDMLAFNIVREDREARADINIPAPPPGRPPPPPLPGRIARPASPGKTFPYIGIGGIVPLGPRPPPPPTTSPWWTLGMRAVKNISGAVSSAGEVISGAVKSLTPVSPKPVAAAPMGDADFLFRLQTVMAVFEELRFAEALYRKNFPMGNINLNELINNSKSTITIAVLHTCRFLAASLSDVAWTGITQLVEAVRLAVLTLNTSSLTGSIPDLTPVNQKIKAARDAFVLSSLPDSPEILNIIKAVVSIVQAIQNSIDESMIVLTDSQKVFIVEYDSVVIRNVAASAVGRSTMRLPQADAATMNAVEPSIREAAKLKLPEPTADTTNIIAEQRPSRAGSSFFNSGPSVSDLGSAFDKESAAILSRTGLGRSAEISGILTSKRDVEIKRSLGITYVSDIDGNLKPTLPEQVTEGLLPFMLVANAILTASSNPVDGSPQLVPEALARIHSIDMILSLTILMSDSRRLLADNLELTFGAGYHGYFVEPTGIKVLERIAKVVADMPEWTKKIGGFSIDKTSESNMTYVERAMLSVVSVINDYCAVCRPDAKGICDLVSSFSEPAGSITNKTRVSALRRMADSALSANPRSVFGTSLARLCDVIDGLLANPANNRKRLDNIDIKGEFVKSRQGEGSAQERTYEAMNAIHKAVAGVDYNKADSVININLVIDILGNLDNLVRDMTAVVEAAPKPLLPDQQLSEVVKDLTEALKYIRDRVDGKTTLVTTWPQARKALDPNFLNAFVGFNDEIIPMIKTLYRDIGFVVRSRYIGTPRQKGQIPKTLPVAGTEDFALKTPAMQSLPKQIVKRDLVTAIVKNFPRIPGTKEWYDNLGRALQDVYGSQTTPTAVPYDDLARALAATGAITVPQMDLVLERVALPVLTGQLSGVTVPPMIINLDELAQIVYADVFIGTEILAKAIANIVPVLVRLSIGLDAKILGPAIVDAVREAKREKTTLTSSDITNLLISEAVIAGAPETIKMLTARESERESVQRRLAEAIGRVGSFRGGPPPAWTGVTLP